MSNTLFNFTPTFPCLYNTHALQFQTELHTQKRQIRNTEKKVVLTTKSPMFKTRFSKQVIYPHFHTVSELAQSKLSVFTVFHYLHFLIKLVCTTQHFTRAFHTSNNTHFPLYPHTAFQHYQVIINTQTRHLKGSCFF